MASSSAGNSVQEKQQKSRKRKRNCDIPGFEPNTASTPKVTSQAPRAINAEQFASARAVEIKNMVAAIEEAGALKGKRVFQTLPRHMRRRAMSHNVKRMPVRLRQRASFEMHNTANKPETLKKKSRRHRRQPKNLLEEYTRRQHKHVWLETHIWHAKRMKMIDAWGYRLADHPNDKGFRAAYRAAKNNCILQDMSYYGCIEVTGVQSQIIQSMRHLTSQEAGLTIAAKHYLNGTREGNVMLYKFDQFPHGAISPVSFLWRQMVRTETTNTSENVQHSDETEMEQQNVDNDGLTQDHTLLQASDTIHEKEAVSQLWIWSHPASFDSVFDAITEACKSVGRTSVEKDSKFPDATGKDSIIHPEQPDLGTQGIPLVNGMDHSELKVSSRRYDLLRLRLTGPQSHALLANTLKLSTDLKHKASENKSDTTTSHKESTRFCSDKGINISSAKWWQKQLENPKDLLAKSALWEKLKKASSPSVLPTGCVIGLTVLDPRLYLPGKKKSITSTAEEINSEESDSCDERIPPSNDAMNSTDEGVSKAEKKPSFEDIIIHWPSDMAGSHIWDQSVRREVKETKMSEQELNRRRSELLVPSSQLDLNPDEISHIPVLLIQQPGCSGTARDTGVSAGYGSGWDVILPSGWAMAFWIAFVYGGARTGALQESQTLALEQGVPFFPNDFPDTQAGQAYNKKLKEDGEAQYKRYPPAKRPNYDKLGVKSPFSPPWTELVKDWNSSEAAFSDGDAAMKSTSDSLKSSTVVSESPQTDNSVVQPLYVLRSRSKLSILRNYVLRDKKLQKRGSKRCVTISKTPPVNDLSSLVKDDLNSLVCVLIRMVNRNAPVPNSALAIPSKEDTTRLNTCKDASGPVEPLHKGPRAQIASKTLRNSCTREIVGFVSSGHFSLARGCGFGVGFCVLPGLLELLSSASNTGDVVVLVRGPSTQQYRFAYLTIL